jgi:hypothetical protein
MVIVIVIVVYFLTVLFDFIPIVKSGKKKEYLVYLTFLAISFTVLILYGLDIKVPGPTDLIVNSIKGLFGI